MRVTSILSSPEHKVLRVSSCDCALSFVNFLPCARSRGHIFGPITMKLGYRTNLNMAHDGGKNRSLGQMLEKPCVGFTGHIFILIIMKLGQNVCLDEISDDYKNVSCWVKN